MHRPVIRCSTAECESGFKDINICHGRLVLLLTRWRSLVRHVTMRARAARRVARVDVKTACCEHGT